MYRDNHAHERIDHLEKLMEQYMTEQKELAASLKTIADNTKELVDIVKGVKGIRALIVWIAPAIAAIYALYLWLKGG